MHRPMKICVALLVLGAATAAGGAQAKKAAEPAKPNILFIFADNFGYGELGSYGGGGTRGAPTPRLDKLASEGVRLTNFNVEPSCTPSRSALMTGRHPIRSGTYSVPIDGRPYGLVQWEVTTAKLLSAQGYATGHFGKWHLGDSEGRYPTDLGFDEWYGIPNSSDESLWPANPQFDSAFAHLEYVMQGVRGGKSKRVKLYDLEARREIDMELMAKTIDFIKRSVKAGKPFYAYVPITQTHLPTIPSKQFAGKTGHGDWADVLAQMDWQVGQILDVLDALKIQNNTIVIFSSDNGPEDAFPWRGWAGPWSGSYVTGMEGSSRVPFIMRWPGKVPAGRVSNEIVHEVDMFTTFAAITGAPVPTDRAIDGVDQSDFLFGKTEKSAREWLPIFNATELYAVKWRNWKVHFIWQEWMNDAPQKLAIPRLFDLYVTPQERPDESLNKGIQNGWVLHTMSAYIAAFQTSLKNCPPVPVGSTDPYEAPKPPPQGCNAPVKLPAEDAESY